MIDQSADAHAPIVALQAPTSPTADALAVTLSFLGDEFFYLLLIPVVYWTFSTRQALRLAALVLFSTWLNSALKAAWATPRPDPELVRVLDPDVPPGGIPSGHAQNAVVTWGFLAWVTSRSGRGRSIRHGPWIAAGLLALGIGLSRIYLGVHFPVDVLVGWALGIALLTAGLRLLTRLERWLAERRFGTRLGLALGAPALLLVVYRSELGLPAASALGGVWAGAVLAGAAFSFDPASGGWGIRLGRIALGVPGAIAIWLAGPAFVSGWGTAGDIVIYGSIGLWVSLGAPYCFRLVGLGSRPPGGRTPRPDEVRASGL